MIKKDRRRFFRKKGVIDYTILVLITVLAAFAIILVMTFKVFDSVDPDFDICQQSVIARDTFSWGPSEAGREYIPLNCRTQKLCLRTSKSEDCLGGGIVSTQDNKVKNIEISNKPQNSK